MSNIGIYRDMVVSEHATENARMYVQIIAMLRVASGERSHLIMAPSITNTGEAS